MRLLPTENPFTIIFVRTVHGLALDDLDSMRRYRQEMRYLPEEHRALVCLSADPDFYLVDGSVGRGRLAARGPKPVATGISDANGVHDAGR